MTVRSLAGEVLAIGYIKFDTLAQVIQEKMFSAEIKIHEQIAMAWVPYELSISGKFSHCGVDVLPYSKEKMDGEL